MEALKAKLRAIPRFSTRTILTAAAIVTAVALVLGLCISISNNKNMQRRYASARARLGEAVYENLFMMIHHSDELTLTGTDIQGTVLPAMEEYFAVGSALNETLGEAFGARYAVLSADQTARLREAFDAYTGAFKGGLPTDATRTDLIAVIGQVEETLNARYDENGRLIPAAK